jgi:hypothetical protein
VLERSKTLLRTLLLICMQASTLSPPVSSISDHHTTYPKITQRQKLAQGQERAGEQLTQCLESLLQRHPSQTISA